MVVTYACIVTLKPSPKDTMRRPAQDISDVATASASHSPALRYLIVNIPVKSRAEVDASPITPDPAARKTRLTRAM